MIVDVWEVVRGNIAFRALTAGEAEAPPRAHPRAFSIEALACCMTLGEMSSYVKEDRKEHSCSVSVAMGREDVKFVVGGPTIAVGSFFIWWGKNLCLTTDCLDCVEA